MLLIGVGCTTAHDFKAKFLVGNVRINFITYSVVAGSKHVKMTFYVRRLNKVCFDIISAELQSIFYNIVS